jgi:hypothetical protein
MDLMSLILWIIIAPYLFAGSLMITIPREDSSYVVSSYSCFNISSFGFSFYFFGGKITSTVNFKASSIILGI